MTVVIPDPVQLIRSDLYRHVGHCRAAAWFTTYLKNRSFRYTFWLRLCKSQSRVLRTLARLMHKRLSNIYGIQIPACTQIGFGLVLCHHMGVVVNPTVVIGDNCNISQFTTIGSNHDNGAEIGNEVYIGPGVSIVEGVSIGHGATIGAGSVVVKDVPAGATVAGNPAQVISMKDAGRYINHRWVRSAI